MIAQKSQKDRIIEISDMAYAEGMKLRAKNPEHELLRLLADLEDDAIWKEFQDRFGIKDFEFAQEYFWGQYYMALKNAVGSDDNNIKNVCLTKSRLN